MSSLRKIVFAFTVMALLCLPFLVFAETVQFPDQLQIIEQEAFMNDTAITEVSIPESTTTIGARAFSGCTNLEKVIIPAGVTKIDDGAFADCNSLTIYGYSGFRAESYATENNIPFIPLDSDTEGFEFTYDGSNDKYKIYKYTGTDTIPVLPTSYNGKPVTAIADGAFAKTGITRLVIPDGITVIGSAAFYECRSLADVTISGATTSIGSYAFYSCSALTSVAISDAEAIDSGEIGLGFQAFYCCSNLQSITIPGGVKTISGEAFVGCEALQTVVLEEGITALYSKQGFGAFMGLSNLTSVHLPSTLQVISSYVFSGCTSLTDIVIPSSVSEIGSHAFYNCESLTSITIPEDLTTLGEYAFCNCKNLKGSVSVPDSITVIPQYSFYGCEKLEQIFITDSIVKIDDNALNGCSSLTEFTLSGATVYIGSNAFANCTGLTAVSATTAEFSGTAESVGIRTDAFSGCNALEEVVIPGGVKYISGTAFYDCNALTHVVIREGVTNIYSYRGFGAFQHCTNLTTVQLPSTLTEIGDYAFDSCSGLQEINIPDTVIIIGSHAFSECTSLDGTTFTIPEGLTTLGEYAFFNCNNLQGSVSIPGGITAILQCTFYGCEKLEHVFIADSVVKIDDNALNGCSSLTEFTLSGATVYIGSNAFANCTGLTAVSATTAEFSGTAESVGIRIEAFSGCTALEEVVIPGGVKHIWGSAFYDCNALMHVIVREGVTNIYCYRGFGAFQHCANLTTVQLPSTLTEIGDYTFDGCSNLQKINIPNTVRIIGSHAFSECTFLDGVTIPTALTSLGDYAFYKCINMTGSFSLPTGVTEIEPYVFYDCQRLESISILGNITNIPSYAFYNCWELETAVLPESVRTISNYAFYKCYSLSEINLPDMLTSIGSYAFTECLRLPSVNLGQAVSAIGEYAFSDCCSLSCEILLSDEITEINSGTFCDCSQLESITVPNNVTYIAYNAFSGCKNLTMYGYTGSYASTYAKEHYIDFVFLDIPPDYITGTYGDIKWEYYVPWQQLTLSSDEINVSMPNLTEETYTEVPWNEYIENITSVCIRYDLLNIGKYMFYHYPNLEYVTIASPSLTKIDEHAFEGCPLLRNVDIEWECLDSIEAFAFKDCTSLRHIYLPTSLQSIADGAFENILDSYLDVHCEWGSYASDYFKTTPCTIVEEEYTLHSRSCGNMTMEHSIEYYIDTSKSGYINKDLRFLCSMLADAAYNFNTMYTNMVEMGFNRTHYAAGNISEKAGDHVGYTIIEKDIPNGDKIVVVAVRGSHPGLQLRWKNALQFDDPAIPYEWLSNIYVGPVNNYHAGFKAAEEEVYNALCSFTNVFNSKTKILITGHSRGAAVANILAAHLISRGASEDNVFAYTFACPRIGTNNVYKNGPKCKNVFNLNNTNDVVTTLPWNGIDLNKLKSCRTLDIIVNLLRDVTGLNNWGRYGQTDTFVYGMPMGNHDMINYFNYAYTHR